MSKRYCVVGAAAGDPRGRHLVAAADLPAGCCVLREAPYAFALNSDQVGARCGCCLAPPPPGQALARCARCRDDFYPDSTHQRRAWAAGHREECRGLAATAGAGRLPPPAARLALRVALRAHADGELAAGGALLSAAPGGGIAAADERGEVPDPEGFQGVLSLLSHWAAAPDGAKLCAAQLGAWAWRALEAGCPAAATAASPRDLAHLAARLACNNHAICDAELRPLGLGLYPLTAVANHGCAPTCAHTFGAGGAVELRTIRPVAAGEELTIAYVELAAPRWERRRALLAGHFFDIDGGGDGPEGAVSRVVSVLEPEWGRHVHYRGAAPPWRHDPRDLALSSLGPDLVEGGVWGRVIDPKDSEETGEQLMTDLADAAAGEAVGDGSGSRNQREREGPGGQARLEVHTWAGGCDLEHVNALKDLAARCAEALRALHDAAIGGAAPPELATRLRASLDSLTAPSNGAIALGPRHVLRLRLLAALLKAKVDAGGRWAEALQAARDLLPLYEFAYPGDLWPPLALHLATLAKLEHLAGATAAAAAAAARRALAGLDATAGPGGEARAEMEMIWREAAAEAEGRAAE